MSDITIYTKDYCPYCARAKALLRTKGADFTEIDVTHDPELQAEMMDRSRRRTVPQIFIDGRHIGGSDDLAALNAEGELDPLLGTAESAAPDATPTGLSAGADRRSGVAAAIDAARAGVQALVVAVAVFVGGALFDAPAANAQQACGDRAEFVEKLGKAYAEAPRAIGLSDAGTIVEVLVSPSGSWTILVNHPNSVTCLVAAGQYWESLPAVGKGPST